MAEASQEPSAGAVAGIVFPAEEPSPPPPEDGGRTEPASAFPEPPPAIMVAAVAVALLAWFGVATWRRRPIPSTLGAVPADALPLGEPLIPRTVAATAATKGSLAGAWPLAAERAMVRFGAVSLTDVPDETTGTTVAEVHGGDEVVIVDRQGVWVRVRTAAGVEGWAHRTVLGLRPTPPPMARG